MQFTQEVRIASAANAPIRLSDRVPLKWQAGVFAFVQSYEQDAVNAYSPFVLSPQLPLAVSQHSPQATLDDAGVGVFGQATVTLAERVDVTGGARMDHENKTASLRTFYSPAIAPERLVTPEESFSNVSPQMSVAVRLSPDRLVYASMARGFKAGGFNAASPVGQRSIRRRADLESRRRREDDLGGWPRHGQRRGVSHRLGRSAAEPARSCRAGTVLHRERGRRGEQRCRGGGARTGAAWQWISSAPLGTRSARFSDGSISSGVNVAGNAIPNTPDYTAMFGSQLSRSLRCRLHAVRWSRRHLRRRLQVRRPEHGGAGGLLAGQPSCRRPRPAPRGAKPG